MAKIVVIQGHPDPAGNRLCHALASAYINGATSVGHDVFLFDVGKTSFPILQTAEDFHRGVDGTPQSLIKVQNAIGDADHIVIFYPLWMGTMPALLKAFIEQVFRPGFALKYGDGFPKSGLKGKSAHVIVTMGMPAFAYRWFYLSHSLKSLQRNVLRFSGIKPVRTTIFGGVEAASDEKRVKWIEDIKALGARFPKS